MKGSAEVLSEALIADDGNYQNFLLKVQMTIYRFQINVIYVCDDAHIHWLLTSVFQIMPFTHFPYLFFLIFLIFVIRQMKCQYLRLICRPDL